MPRPNMNITEKSKDFKGSLLKLYKSIGAFKKLLITAMILALFSAILSAVAPNKLADVTDVISAGITPNTEKLQEISQKMASGINSNILLQNVDLTTIPTKEEEYFPWMIERYKSLDESSKNVLFNEFEMDGVVVTKEDQVQLMNCLINLNIQEGFTQEMLNTLDELPASVQKIIEPKIDEKALKERSLILAIIYLLGAIFSYFQGIIMAYVSNGYSKDLRKNISNKINKLPLKYFDTHETGDVLSRVTNDVDSIGMNLSHSLASLVSNVTLFLGSILMMFITNWIMAFTAIAASIFGFVFSVLLLKKSQKYFVARQEQLGKLNGHIEEIYSGHNVVKTYNGEEEAMKEFDKINNKLFISNRKSQFLSGIMQPIMGFIGNFGYVAVCVVGAILVMNDYTTFGTIVAFMIYVRLFTNPLSQIAQSLTSLQATAAAGERIFEFMDENELTDEKHLTKQLLPTKVKGNIDFENVKFGYDPNKTIIKNFTAHVKAGEKIAIVGPTGAGKTTMVNLLMKFYEINEGDIKIDNVSIKELTRENIHDLFIMVLQDTWLFEGTVKDNIKYNKKDISDDEIWQVCKTVGIDHFIKTLPGGLKSEVNDNEAISKGQKQLLTIARGMIEDAPFLILDEATSNVDTRTEELVQKAMDKLMVGRTSFIIAHRLSTIKNADLILVMNEGNIVEQGKHEELIKKNGFYTKLYNSQFQK